jgi:hypothetical protein
VGHRHETFMSNDPSVTTEMSDGELVEARGLTFDTNLEKFVPKGTGTPKQKKNELQFCMFQPAALYQIAKSTHSAELVILTRLYELWFAHFKRNPVKFNAEWFQKLGFERHLIGSTLKKLEQTGQISVERRAGKCLLVTLKKTLFWK